jgi:hypothetical protein
LLDLKAGGSRTYARDFAVHQKQINDLCRCGGGIYDQAIFCAPIYRS